MLPMKTRWSAVWRASEILLLALKKSIARMLVIALLCSERTFILRGLCPLITFLWLQIGRHLL